MPLEVIKRNLDGMAAVKLNVFHWHLSDNQGFRVESKKFPKLQEKGSDGFYYTQAEVRDIIAYAADRGIRVIPEFDMPGHSTAWFVGYPQLASGPGPYQIERRWGVFDPAMDPTRDDTYKFLESFIAEMAKLFPDQYFHIGGDEVNGKEWDANPKIQAFMHSHNIKNNAELQAYFNKRVEKIVSKNHKTMLGWDEILQPDIPKSIVIQSWRGQASLAQAAKQGIPGILSAGYYLDLMYPTSQHYAVDPLGDAAASLTPEQQKLVLGGEACEWAEFASPEIIDSRIWPRNAAIAERLWSPQNITDMASMYARMYQESERLDWLGLTHNSNYQPMLRRIADTDDLTPLQTLADVVEPVKAYAREGLVTTAPTSQTPLNRLIDAARPESETARRFALMVDDFLANKTNGAAIRQQLIRWRDNDAQFQPMIQHSFLLTELAPLSQQLSALATAGLDALDGNHPETQQAIIDQAKKPQAQLLLVIAPAIQKLINKN
jgi:hexosaminidase